MPILLLAFFLLAETIAMGGRHSLNEVAFNLANSNEARDFELLRRETERFVAQFGEVPASLPALANTPGYEAVHGIRLRNNFELRRVTNIGSANLRIDRAIIAMRGGDYTSAQEVINDNACGANVSAASWCNESGYGYAFDTRRTILDKQKQSAIQLNDLFYRLASIITYKQDVPSVTSAGSQLSNGASGNLAQYVGQSGGANGCSGVYHFEGVALSCSDLYDVEGNPIIYNYFGNRGFAVVITLNERESSNQQILIYKAAFL